ncbi:MAG: hypothetical protein IT324_11975 [Anaerolineae bacterium]|nr:hypothetical protein [Anaerolineae bacterium]
MAVLDQLLNGLNNPDPAVRIDTLRVLATLEETQALPACRALIQTETNPDVINTIKWAGNLIWQAERKGHSTEAGLRAYFRHDLAQTEDEQREAAKLAEVQQRMEIERIKDQQNAPMRQLGSTLAAGAFGMMLGGPATGAGMMMASAMAGLNNPSSGLDPRPTIGKQVIPPQRPSTMDISVWVRRLKDSTAEARQKALIELAHLNNPAALSAIGAVFALDSDPQVQEAAQRAAKALYYNWVQWEIEEAKQPRPAGPTPEQQSAAEILAKAQAAKERKRKTQLR